MICPHCLSENRDGAKYCDECGFALAAEYPGNGGNPEEYPYSPIDVSDEGFFEDGCYQNDGIEITAPLDQISDSEAFETAQTASLEQLEDPNDFEFSQTARLDQVGEPLDFEASQTAPLDQVGGSEGLDAPNTVPVQANDSQKPDEPFIRSDYDDSGFDHADDFAGIEFANFFPEDTTDPNEQEEKSGSRQRVYVAPENSRKALRKQRRMQKKAYKEQLKQGLLTPADGSYVPYKPKRSFKGLKVALISFAVVAAVMGGIAAGTYYLEMWGGKTVPNVTGMTQSDATYLLESKGFTVRTTQVSSDDTEGLVLLADPASGSREPDGTEVVLHVAVSRVVPEVVGLSHSDAVNMLNAAGYRDIEVKTEKSDKATGTVLDVTPIEGSKARSTQTITLKEAEPYRVPDVVGNTLETAQTTIENEGFKANITYEYSDDTNAGTVLRTNPEANEEVKSGSTITLIVAKSREDELVQAAYTALADREISLKNGQVFKVETVNSVTYEGNDTCSFTATGTASTAITILKQRIPVKSDEQTVSGTITFDKDNNVKSCEVRED